METKIIFQDTDVQFLEKETPENLHTFNFLDIFINKNKSMSKKLTTKEFIELANVVHDSKYDYSQVNYINTNTKVKIICPIHGVFEQRPNDHISKKCGCYKCSGKGVTNEEFIYKLQQVHGFKYDYSRIDYKGHDYNIEIKCDKHGLFNQLAYTHLKGSGCSKCRNEKLNLLYKTSLGDFIEKSVKIHGEKYSYLNVFYINGRTKVDIVCKKHGSFKQIPESHLRGRGCPVCSESKGEKMVSKILNDFNVEYEREKTFDGCVGKKRKLPFDFYLPAHNLCIEYDGKQHFIYRNNSFGAIGEKAKSNFEKLLKNDETKNIFCHQNKIKLVRIKYNQPIAEIIKTLKQQIYGDR